MIFPRRVAFRFLVIFSANKLIVQLFSHRRQSTKTTTATETNPITNLITNLIPNKLLQATRRSGDRQNLSPKLAETNRDHTHTHTPTLLSKPKRTQALSAETLQISGVGFCAGRFSPGALRSPPAGAVVCPLYPLCLPPPAAPSLLTPPDPQSRDPQCLQLY